MPTRTHHETVVAGGREIAVSNPQKVLFPQAGYTKLDLVRYYLAVSDGALRAAGGRPNVLVRYPDGVGGEFFYQKRAPTSRPPWIEVVALRFPSGRSAEEVVPRDAAALAWMANLACLELHPHPVRAEDLDHPDELRVDLDPVPGVGWDQVREVARVVRAALGDLALTGWPKTSGSRGMHIVVRIERRWTFDQVRRAALALARDVERRASGLATSKWWKEERHGVFVDYNQNAKDRTVAAAYSVRPTPDARVSAPLTWDEVDACDPRDFTLKTMPGRFAEAGDRHAGIDERVCSLESLLELSKRHERDGLGDAPWPPHYRKQSGEPARVQPSRRRQRSGVEPAGERSSRRHATGAALSSVDPSRGRSGVEPSDAAASDSQSRERREPSPEETAGAREPSSLQPSGRRERSIADVSRRRSPGVEPSAAQSSGARSSVAQDSRGREGAGVEEPLVEPSGVDPSDAAASGSRSPERREPSGGTARDLESSEPRGSSAVRPSGRRESKSPREPSTVRSSGRREPKFPLIEIARAKHKEDALAGLERWRARHAEAASHLEPADVLVDAMRGRHSTWTRIRLNLQHVPPELRPPQEPPDPDERG